MSYSQGGRGDKRHQWGHKAQAEPSAPRRVKIVKEAAPDLEVVIRLSGQPDRLVKCPGCGARLYESILKEEHGTCFQCGGHVPTAVPRTEDHLYRMYRH